MEVIIEKLLHGRRSLEFVSLIRRFTKGKKMEGDKQ
jgi:hypothetical protein